MNVRTLCLSILHDRDATGYEIRRMCVEGEYSYFIEASFGSIYPALSKLREDGLVTSRTEQQDGKPAKKIYSITDAGRASFAGQLAEPLGEDLFRSPFLLFARFVHIMPRELVEERANAFMERKISEHCHILKAQTECSSNASDAWVIGFGRAMMEAAEKHMRSHMHELISLAQVEPSKDAAE